MRKPVKLNQDNMFDVGLAKLVQHAIEHTTFRRIKFYEHNNMYSYEEDKDGYSLQQMIAWDDEANLIDLQETFCNVYKAEYGVKPRWATTEQMNDKYWLKEQLEQLKDRQIMKQGEIYEA